MNYVGMTPGKDVIFLNTPFSSLPSSDEAGIEWPDGWTLGFKANNIFLIVNHEFAEASPTALAVMNGLRIPISDLNAMMGREEAKANKSTVPIHRTDLFGFYGKQVTVQSSCLHADGFFAAGAPIHRQNRQDQSRSSRFHPKVRPEYRDDGRYDQCPLPKRDWSPEEPFQGRSKADQCHDGDHAAPDH